MRLQDYDTTVQTKATVVSTERITPASTDEVRELILDVEGTELDLDVGQSVGVMAPGQKEFGQEHHFRLYTIADLPEKTQSGLRVKLCVKRCDYVDEYSGERYNGIASNYLCDLRPGQTLTLTGPYGLAFEVPHELDANLLMIGTGIAPFRAFVKHIHKNVPEWKGRTLLFYGAKSGLDMLYMNDEKDDFTQYYDPTFR